MKTKLYKIESTFYCLFQNKRITYILKEWDSEEEAVFSSEEEAKKRIDEKIEIDAPYETFADYKIIEI
jgi:hypothetical protein